MSSPQSHQVARQLSVSLGLTSLGFLLGPIRLAFLTRTLGLADYGTLSILTSAHFAGAYLLSLCIYQWVFYTSSTSEASGDDGASPLSTAFALHAAVSVALLFPLVTLHRSAAIALGTATAPTETALVLAATLMSPAFLSAAQFIYAKKRVGEYNLLVFLRANLWLLPAVAVLAVPTRARLLAACAAFAATSVLITLVSTARAVTSGSSRAALRPQMAGITQALGYSLPLYPFAIAAELVPVFPRVALAHTAGVELTGRFVVAYTLTEFLLTGALAAFGTLLPYFFADLGLESHSENLGQRTYAQTSEVALVGLTLGLATLWACAPPLIHLLTGEADPFPTARAAGALLPATVLRYVAIVRTHPALARGATARVGLAYGIAAGATAICVSVGAALHGLLGAALGMTPGPVLILSFLHTGEQPAAARRATLIWAAAVSLAIAALSTVGPLGTTARFAALLLAALSAPRNSLNVLRQPLRALFQ